jgi:hypothetical protein
LHNQGGFYVINSKINTYSKTPLPQTRSLVKDQAAIGLADSTVQIRAYELYELRGKIDGFAEHDWYKAENNLRGQQQTKRSGHECMQL